MHATQMSTTDDADEYNVEYNVEYIELCHSLCIPNSLNFSSSSFVIRVNLLHP